MAKDFWDIQAVEVARDGGALVFTAVMDGPSGSVRIPITAEALRSYSTFQKELLAYSAIMYMHSFCEGRPELVADESWRNMTRQLLDRVLVVQAQSHAQGGGSTMN